MLATANAAAIPTSAANVFLPGFRGGTAATSSSLVTGPTLGACATFTSVGVALAGLTSSMSNSSSRAFTTGGGVLLHERGRGTDSTGGSTLARALGDAAGFGGGLSRAERDIAGLGPRPRMVDFEPMLARGGVRTGAFTGALAESGT